MNWYLLAFKKYSEFSGRSRRKEYWMFVLINALISYLFLGVDYATGMMWETTGLLSTIYGLATLVPNLALGARRMHDVGKSGWTYLWILLPVLGWIYVIYLLVKDGDEGENQYGLDPKNPHNELDEIGNTSLNV